MVAYNFQSRFADDVERRRKRRTTRGLRKRHARVGEPVQLYTGMRTTACRKLIDPDPVCIAVTPLRMRLGPEPRVLLMLAGMSALVADLNAFAQLDGFEHFAAMSAWFDPTGHGLDMQLVMIEWEPQT